MDLTELIAQAPSFELLKAREKICLFAWYLHAHRNVEAFDNAAMRACFTEIDAVDPNVARELPRMANKKPPDLIRTRAGYKLEGSLRRSLDAKYGAHSSVVAVTKLLSELPKKLPELSEQIYLSEALDCYKVRAYRAAIIMVWNLSFDHLVRWITGDAKRLSDFNHTIGVRFPKKASCQVNKIEDMEEFKESETIEILRTAKLISKNVVEILRDKLKRRNIAAHPSPVVVTQAQADDAITDLVNNVVLALRT
jgi:hypothetical protein